MRTPFDDAAVNIGNARLYGMEEDLGMNPRGNQFQIAVSILFVTYVVSFTASKRSYCMLTAS